MNITMCPHANCFDFFQATGIEDYHHILDSLMERENVGNDSIIHVYVIEDDEDLNSYEMWEIIISNGLKKLGLRDLYLEISW